jgi:hypothetical protein
MNKQIPQKAWCELTPKEQKDLQPEIKNVYWKAEGQYGPVYIVFKQIAKEPGQFFKGNIMRAYAIDETVFPGKKETEWFSLAKAKKIAKSLKVELDY